MADREVLLRLAERCEREEPGKHLDAYIGAAIGAKPKDKKIPKRGHYIGGKAVLLRIERVWPAYTTSLDAAVTLVPEGFAWSAGAETRSNASVDKWGEISEQGVAQTPALALCAASLRARAAALPDTKEG